MMDEYTGCSSHSTHLFYGKIQVLIVISVCLLFDVMVFFFVLPAILSEFPGVLYNVWAKGRQTGYVLHYVWVCVPLIFFSTATVYGIWYML